MANDRYTLCSVIFTVNSEQFSKLIDFEIGILRPDFDCNQ